MAMKLQVTYNPNLDTLYLTSPSCSGKWMDSHDGMFFFLVYNQRTDASPTGFEIHHFTEVWDDKKLLPRLDMRFDVLGTEVKEATLKEVLRWAFEQYVAKKPGAFYIEPEEQYVAVREGEEEPGYES
jgi:hypothetical protein